MSKKVITSLRFNYVVNGKKLSSSYKGKDDFLNAQFPKNNNPLAPTLDTVINNIVWDRKIIFISDSSTIRDLVYVLSNDNLKKYIIKDLNRVSQPKRKKHKKLIRKEIYTIEEVRNKVKDVLFEKNRNYSRVDFDGDLIKGNSQRYQTFFTKGCKCVVCGIEGKYFAKEKHLNSKRYHLNLYAIDDNGDEVLMTKDHIIPRSKGGIDDISNYQTMCEPCNKAKGNKLEN